MYIYIYACRLCFRFKAKQVFLTSVLCIRLKRVYRSAKEISQCYRAPAFRIEMHGLIMN